jgi:NADPH2:quinone reductase
MKAVLINEYGGPEVLSVGDAPIPAPTPQEVLIRVAAVGTNPADWKWRAGWYVEHVVFKFPHILGYDIAGTIAKDERNQFAPGARVLVKLDSIRQGAYAEWAIAARDAVAILPDAVEFAIGATLPTAGLTGVQMIEDQLNVMPGQRILVTGAAGSVGRFAMYAAKARGADIVAAVRASQRDEAMALGASSVVTLGEEPWRGRDFDGVADTVGGMAVAELCRYLAPNGLIRTVSTTAIPGDGLPAPVVFFGVHDDGPRLAALAAAVAAGRVNVPIVREFPLEEALTVHRLLEAGGLGGKIVMRP